MEQGYTYKYPHPAVTADCVVFGFDGRELKILLIERGNDPYKGCWAFPGGFMNIDETAEQCAKRELKEETGLDIANIEQLYTFTEVNRDPRERVITVAYYGFVKLAEVKGSDDAARAQWFALNDIPRLAFDHDKILSMAIQTLRNKAIAKQISDSIVKDFTKTEQQKILDMISEQKSERIAPDFIRSLEKNEIFVFGSNLAGAHGGGAARIAMDKFGAVWGQGVGLQGQSYAIPTMQGGVETIKPYVDEFIEFAKAHPEYKFLVTRIGCGIAGFTDDEIAPLFRNARQLGNVWLPESFIKNM